MGSELFTLDSNLLIVWMYGLIFTLGMAVFAGLFPDRLEKVRKSAFAFMIFPGLVFALVYAVRGFGTLERPLVHWVFEKGAQDSLRLGLVFDPLSFAAVLFTGAATIAIGTMNRPSIRMSAALALSWLGIALAATSQTLWMAALGIGVQLLSRTFPLIEGSRQGEGDDSRWLASTKRAWIGLAAVVCGAAGLAAQGVHLDFFSETGWSVLENTPSTLVAGGLLILGLLVMAAPALASNSLFSAVDGEVEENIFVSESSLAWIAVIIFFRLFGTIHEPQWLLVIGVGATVATAGSLLALSFQSTKRSALHLWLSTLPVASLMILPFLPAREAFLTIVGLLLAWNGLWISLNHRRSKMEIAASAVFFVGAFGFVGWSTAAGFANFFSKFESDPFLRAPVFLLWFIYAAFGARLVFRGGDRETSAPSLAKWIVLGLFFLIGFGPLISGRWSGGSIPGETDWIDGAKGWAWIKAGLSEAGEAEWMGLGITQGLSILGALLGIFVWRSADLYPFAKKYPRGAKAAEGLFGLLWIQDAVFSLLKRSGGFLNGKVSSPIWERGIPAAVNALFTGFRRAGVVAEEIADPLTAGGYSRILTPAAKLVQWLHGGNVRLYAWFALVWILIFSVYLTR